MFYVVVLLSSENGLTYIICLATAEVVKQTLRTQRPMLLNEQTMLSTCYTPGAGTPYKRTGCSSCLLVSCVVIELIVLKVKNISNHAHKNRILVYLRSSFLCSFTHQAPSGTFYIGFLYFAQPRLGLSRAKYNHTSMTPFSLVPKNVY